MTERQICAHAGCSCTLAEEFIERNGQGFCSAACANGVGGCGHEGCKCSASTVSDPVDEASDESFPASDVPSFNPGKA